MSDSGRDRVDHREVGEVEGHRVITPASAPAVELPGAIDMAAALAGIEERLGR